VAWLASNYLTFLVMAGGLLVAAAAILVFCLLSLAQRREDDLDQVARMRRLNLHLADPAPLRPLEAPAPAWPPALIDSAPPPPSKPRTMVH